MLDLGVHATDSDKEKNENSVEAFVVLYSPIFDPNHVIAAILHHFQLTNVLSFFDADLGLWVKHKSTT